MTDPALPALSDADIERLQALLDRSPAPLEPLDTSSLDGFVCGIALQPAATRPPAAEWLAYVVDVEGRREPHHPALAELHALVRRRADELDAAIDARRWFDPWIYRLDDAASPSESLLPWVAGFAAAQELFAGLPDDPALVEPLALLYLHLPPDDIDSLPQALADAIAELEPPAELGEAVEDLVSAVFLIADVTRPRRR